jgi:hypothetical protein
MQALAHAKSVTAAWQTPKISPKVGGFDDNTAPALLPLRNLLWRSFVKKKKARDVSNIFDLYWPKWHNKLGILKIGLRYNENQNEGVATLPRLENAVQPFL